MEKQELRKMVIDLELIWADFASAANRAERGGVTPRSKEFRSIAADATRLASRVAKLADSQDD